MFFYAVRLFVCGAMGNQWAWQNKDWKNIKQYKRIQKKWGLGGFLTWIGIGFMLLLYSGTNHLASNNRSHFPEMKNQTYAIPVAVSKPEIRFSFESEEPLLVDVNHDGIRDVVGKIVSVL